jgi:hypothetical protein
VSSAADAYLRDHPGRRRHLTREPAPEPEQPAKRPPLVTQGGRGHPMIGRPPSPDQWLRTNIRRSGGQVWWPLV